MNEEQIRAWLIDQIAEATRSKPQEIDICEPFDSYGLSSTEAVALSGDLEDLLGRQLSPTLLYEYPTIRALSEYLGGEPRATQHPLPEIPSDS